MWREIPRAGRDEPNHRLPLSHRAGIARVYLLSTIRWRGGRAAPATPRKPLRNLGGSRDLIAFSNQVCTRLLARDRDVLVHGRHPSMIDSRIHICLVYLAAARAASALALA